MEGRGRRLLEETRKGRGWYATFVLLIVVAFVMIYVLTGQDALGAAARFVWNGLVFLANGFIRVAGSLMQMLARGVGWRRLSKLASVVTGVGLGYAASLVASDTTIGKARGLRGKLQAAIRIMRENWQAVPLWGKLLIVAALIASQIYLHVVLVIFPIAFLVPVVRRLGVRIADVVFGNWYWRTFGSTHRSLATGVRRLPLVSPLLAAMRLLRLRYLSAWRLWRYHPRYRDPETGRRQNSFVEPLRLWRRGELDIYVGRPLLAGPQHASRLDIARRPTGEML
jgi:hypothetical protein